MLSMETKGQYPDLNSGPAEVEDTIQSLILRIFPAAVVSRDESNIGFGSGSGCKDLVWVVSPCRKHVNLGIVNLATLADPHGLVQGSGRVHRRAKQRRHMHRGC
jgi:hypothetical protein